MNDDDREKLEHDAYQKERDRLIAYWSETRHRVDTLIKAMFVLSGGALTISIGIFLRPDHPILDGCHIKMLHWSWGLFFTSVICSSLMMFIMICQGYFEANVWKNAMRGRWGDSEKKKPSVRGSGSALVLNSTIGPIGFVAFLVGFLLLALVSISATAPLPR